MTLLEVAEQIEQFNDNQVIYAVEDNGEWWPDSEVYLLELPQFLNDDIDVALRLTEERGVPPHLVGAKYFLEVNTAKEVVQAYQVRSEAPLSSKQRVNALIYYAVYDACNPDILLDA